MSNPDVPTRTCCGKIALPGDKWRSRYKPCTHKAKAERDGKWYCGQHDPVARAAKMEAQHAKWKADDVVRAARSSLNRAAPKMLEALKLIWDTCGMDPSVDSAIWQTVRVAITKAEGDGKSG